MSRYLKKKLFYSCTNLTSFDRNIGIHEISVGLVLNFISFEKRNKMSPLAHCIHRWTNCFSHRITIWRSFFDRFSIFPHNLFSIEFVEYKTTLHNTTKYYKKNDSICIVMYVYVCMYLCMCAFVYLFFNRLFVNC